MTDVVGRGQLQRDVLFGAMGALAFVLAAVPTPPGRPGVYAAAVVVALAAVGLAVLDRRRARSGASVGPPVAFVVAVALARDATGGAGGGFGAVLFLPIVWIALYGTGRQLAVVVAAAGAVLIAPLLLIGGSAYPASGWRVPALLVPLLAIVGVTVQQLVHELRGRLTGLERRDGRRQAQLAATRRLADTDALTGVLNRRGFETHLRRSLATGEPAACMALLDLDGFKAVNDAHGHQAGDDTLRACADEWRAVIRPGDVLGRLGGDEFAVLLPNCDLLSATVLLERLRQATPPPVTASVGVLRCRPGDSPDVLLAAADRALYEAKRQGRDRVVAAG